MFRIIILFFTIRYGFLCTYTVEPLYKGHVGTRGFVLIPYLEVNMYRNVMSSFEVSYIQSVLYQKFHCTHTMQG